jgi:hypothetical protein
VDSSLSTSTGTLQPRYRRVLSFGDVLDESIRLFRQHWVTYALVSAVSLLAPGLIGIWLSASGVVRSGYSLADIQTGRLVPAAATTPQLGPAQVAALVGAGILSALFYFVWSAAVTATTDTYLRGGEPTLSRIYRRALRRAVAVFVGSLLVTLAISLLGAVATVLLVITLFGGLVGIVPTIGLIVWWLNPGARKGWLKWLIILCAPFGLALYFGVRWSMFVAAIVLERLGPVAALRRSSELVNKQDFRVLAILTVSSLIVGVLLYAPAALIEIPLMLSSAARGVVGLDPAGAAISNAVTVVLRILFQSVGAIVYTLMFVDLRNRREGTDMAERLTQLEASPITPGG